MVVKLLIDDHVFAAASAPPLVYLPIPSHEHLFGPRDNDRYEAPLQVNVYERIPPDPLEPAVRYRFLRTEQRTPPCI